MKTKIFSIIIILILGVLLFSCGTNQSEQTPAPVDSNALRTEAVSTYASSLTATLVAIPVASPTLTASPTPTAIDVTATLGTPQTANPCYKLIWIKDLTIPDGQQMKPNEVFTKTWQVQNVGGCTVPVGFTFNNVGGDPMRGQTVKLKEAIPVGAKRELSVKLIVPSGINGLIQSSWRMADLDGNYFGDTLSVNIVVGDITTPAVTSTP